jgi:hypothetical protein
MPPVPHPATSAVRFFPSPLPRGLAGPVARLMRRTLIVVQCAVCLAPVEGLAQLGACVFLGEPHMICEVEGYVLEKGIIGEDVTCT